MLGVVVVAGDGQGRVGHSDVGDAGQAAERVLEVPRRAHGLKQLDLAGRRAAAHGDPHVVPASGDDAARAGRLPSAEPDAPVESAGPALVPEARVDDRVLLRSGAHGERLRLRGGAVGLVGVADDAGRDRIRARVPPVDLRVENLVRVRGELKARVVVGADVEQGRAVRVVQTEAQCSGRRAPRRQPSRWRTPPRPAPGSRTSPRRPPGRGSAVAARPRPRAASPGGRCRRARRRPPSAARAGPGRAALAQRIAAVRTAIESVFSLRRTRAYAPAFPSAPLHRRMAGLPAWLCAGLTALRQDGFVR